jgi:hypothetical protein
MTTRQPQDPACPDDKYEQLSPATPPPQERSPWPPLGGGVIALGIPGAVWILHPLIGEILVADEMLALLTIIGTALFGSRALSERAFRLPRWLSNRPEPQERDHYRPMQPDA